MYYHSGIESLGFKGIEDHHNHLCRKFFPSFTNQEMMSTFYKTLVLAQPRQGKRQSFPSCGTGSFIHT